MSEWPIPYLPDPDPTGTGPEHPAPRWSTRKMANDAGSTLAIGMLAKPAIAEHYRDFAHDGRQRNAEHRDDFKEIINGFYGDGDYAAFNANDFANVHHVAWIRLLRALASLTNQNPHGDWADPPPNRTVHMEETPLRVEGREVIFLFHYVPNKTGYYAMGTSDPGLAAPNTGV